MVFAFRWILRARPLRQSRHAGHAIRLPAANVPLFAAGAFFLAGDTDTNAVAVLQILLPRGWVLISQHRQRLAGELGYCRDGAVAVQSERTDDCAICAKATLCFCFL